MGTLDLLVAIEVLNKLNGEALLGCKLSARLAKNTTDVVPWTLVLWCKPYSILSKLDLTVNDITWDSLIVLDLATVWCADFWIGEDEEEAVRPCRVVADIIFNECLDGSELRGVLTLRWEEVQLANDVLAVRPDVVVLGVLLEHLGQKVDLRLGETEDGGAAGGDDWVEFVDQQLPVVPDLVVLLVRKGDFVDPSKLIADWVANGEDDSGTVEPNGVVGWVEIDEVGGQVEATLRVLLIRHNCAQICNDLKIVSKHDHINLSTGADIPTAYSSEYAIAANGFSPSSCGIGLISSHIGLLA